MFSIILLGFIVMLSNSYARNPVHVFILSGQSNMVGLKLDESFAPTVEAAFGKNNVLISKDNSPGKAIRCWDKQWVATPERSDFKPANRGYIYERQMKNLKEDLGEREILSVTYIWMQGERDAKEEQAPVYADSFKRIIEQLKDDLNVDQVNVVIGRISDFDMKDERYKHWTKMRAVHEKLVTEFAFAALVNTDDLNDGLSRNGKVLTNDLHYSADGYKELGQRFADEAIKLVKQQSNL